MTKEEKSSISTLIKKNCWAVTNKKQSQLIFALVFMSYDGYWQLLHPQFCNKSNTNLSTILKLDHSQFKTEYAASHQSNQLSRFWYLHWEFNLFFLKSSSWIWDGNKREGGMSFWKKESGGPQNWLKWSGWNKRGLTKNDGNFNLF